MAQLRDTAPRPFSLRLDPAWWLCVSVLLGALSVAGAFPPLFGLAGILLFGCCRRLVSVALLVVVAIAFGAAAYRARIRAGEFMAERDRVVSELGSPRRCAVEGTVRTSPVVRDDLVSFRAVLRGFDCDGVRLEGAPLARLYGGPRSLGRGDEFEAVVSIAPVRLWRNADLPSAIPFAARQGETLSGSVLALSKKTKGHGLAAWIDAFRAQVRERIDATFHPDAVGLGRALVLGENDIDDAEHDAFQKSGLLHLLAVSGTHLVFSVVLFVRALSWLLCWFTPLSARIDVRRVSGALGALLSLLYADFAGGSGSAWRAAWMLCVVFLGQALGRRVRAGRAVAVSLLVGWWFDPLLPFDYSFMLSVAATLGLLGPGRWLSTLTRPMHGAENRVVQLLVQASTATLSSMLPCLPLLAFLSEKFTWCSVGANVLAAPLGELLALPLCLGHALLSPFPTLERVVAWAASGALLCIGRVARAAADVHLLRFSVPLPNGWHLLAIGLGAGAALFRFARPYRAEGLPDKGEFGREARLAAVAWVCGTLVMLVLVEVQTAKVGNPRGLLRVTALDVGQGDSTLLDLPDGQAMLIDGGGLVGSHLDPGRRVILPVLRARRRRRLDVMVLSHPHPDHYLGLISVLESIEVGELWDTGFGEPEPNSPYGQLLALAREKGVPILRPKELCHLHQLGGAKLQVFSPCPGPDPTRGANDNSFVLRLEYGARAALLVGDAEREEERTILDEHASLLHADVLKVGHHGSRTSSTPAFIAAVAPELAWISCGVRNRFGHPHAQTLRTLARARVPWFRIDQRGSLVWQTDGRIVRLSN